jgi:hypothetical protein
MSVPYTFYLVWRLLANLPPSAKFVLTLSQNPSDCKRNDLMHYLRSLSKYQASSGTTATDVHDYLYRQDANTDFRALLKQMNTAPLHDPNLFLAYWSAIDQTDLLEHVHLISYHLSSLVVGEKAECAPLVTFLIGLFGMYEVALKSQFDLGVDPVLLANGQCEKANQLNPSLILNIGKILPKDVVVQVEKQLEPCPVQPARCEVIYRNRFTSVQLSLRQAMADCLRFLVGCSKYQQSRELYVFFIRLNGEYFLDGLGFSFSC